MSLQQQASEVIRAGGSAYLVQLQASDPVQDRQFRALFDRTGNYATLKIEIDKLMQSLATTDVSTSRRTLKRLTREFAAFYDIDFFPGAARDQVGILLSEATAGLSVITNPDEPQPARGKIKKLRRNDYHQRTWATRKRMWVDRMASAWLIRRFIDPAAKFKWLDKPQDCPKTALGFDFDGATFTHVGSLVTFEVLLASFITEPDPALERLAAVVHFLDVGGIPPAEAPGLELILKGMRERCPDDDVLLGEACRIFDDLYLTYTNEESKDEQ